MSILTLYVKTFFLPKCSFFLLIFKESKTFFFAPCTVPITSNGELSLACDRRQLYIKHNTRL